jgi:MFS family permease
LRRVGHVRVFAALASLVSAAFILFAAVVDPIAWFLMRVIIGFCFSGIYVVAESWLNDSATNETRGQTMSAYVTAQMMGIVLAQALLNVADPNGYDLFVIMSVLVSISFAPILLSSSPVPMFETTRRMSLARLFQTSPLGCVGQFLLGAIFGTLFGMGSVYASAEGMSTLEISIFIGAIYIGGMFCQLPIGWASDRMDRRVLIAGVTAVGAVAAFAAVVSAGFMALIGLAFFVGGAANPLYSLLTAYVNDNLEHEDMASAAGGLILINGLGALGAPILVGYLMDWLGNTAFFLFIGWALAAVCAYALWRMTRRAATPVDETGPMVAMTPIASQVAVDAAWEAAIEQAQEEEEPEVAAPTA